MKTIFLFTFLGITLSFYSCNLFTQRKAVKLNQLIVSTNDSLFAIENRWSGTLSEAIASGNYEKLAKVRATLEHHIDSCKNRIQNTIDAGSSLQYRNCELDLLSFEKQMVFADFIPFEKFSFRTPMDRISLHLNRINADGKLERKKIEQLMALQKEYALKNGLKIEPYMHIK